MVFEKGPGVRETAGVHGFVRGQVGGMMGVRRLVVGALIVDDSHHPWRVLAARRSTPPVGRWEFPGGKVEAGESSRDALVREIREELVVGVEVGQRLDPVSGGRWPISGSLEMELWWCTLDAQPRTGDSHDVLKWLAARELGTVGWLDADRNALPLIQSRLSDS